MTIWLNAGIIFTLLAIVAILMGIRNFWLIKCQRCKEENLSQRII